MDDRTWAEEGAEEVLNRKAAWEAWSERAGLKENTKKAQIMPYTPKAARELAEALQRRDIKDPTVEALEMLGVAAVRSQGRDLVEKEGKRITASIEVLQTIRTLPNTRSDKRHFAKSLAASKAAYGWVAKVPPGRLIDKFDGAVFRAIHLPGSCSKQLKRVIHGADLTLAAQLPNRAMGILMRRLARGGEVVWGARNGRRGQHTTVVRTWMKKLGWVEEGQFRWWHEGMQRRLDARQRTSTGKVENKAEIQHWMREAYRRRHWGKWKDGDTRGAAEAGRMEYSEERCKRARMWTTSETQKTIVMAGFMSPATMAGRENGKGTTLCPWCKRELGSQEHIFWTCPERKKKIAPPADLLQRRLGWPTERDTRERAMEILTWMEETATAVWRDRYGENWKAVAAAVPGWAVDDSETDSDDDGGGGRDDGMMDEEGDCDNNNGGGGRGRLG